MSCLSAACDCHNQIFWGCSRFDSGPNRKNAGKCSNDEKELATSKEDRGINVIKCN